MAAGRSRNAARKSIAAGNNGADGGGTLKCLRRQARKGDDSQEALFFISVCGGCASPRARRPAASTHRRAICLSLHARSCVRSTQRRINARDQSVRAGGPAEDRSAAKAACPVPPLPMWALPTNLHFLGFCVRSRMDAFCELDRDYDFVASKGLSVSGCGDFAYYGSESYK